MTSRPISPAKAANWVLETGEAAWQPRDSQGEVVFRDRMWILGGWYDSYVPAPRDAWSSADGRNWERVTERAGWRSSDIPMVLAFRDRIWFMGGWYNGRLPGHEATREVWWSADGAEWTRAGDAAWSPRMGAGAAVHRDRMWILGGTEDYLFAPDGSRLRNDVWHTADGENWIRATESAAWAPRALHQALAFDGRIWILGGGNYQPEMEVRNDVWCSEDGVRWTRVLEHAPWPARIWFSSAVYRDRMWVMGGSARGNELLADCWYSKDGIEWAELRSEAVWTPRHEHSTFVHRDRIWVAGGHARPLNSEVWSLHLPEDWFREE